MSERKFANSKPMSGIHQNRYYVKDGVKYFRKEFDGVVRCLGLMDKNKDFAGVEVFIYKLLQRLEFGPKIEIGRDFKGKEFIISKELKNYQQSDRVNIKSISEDAFVKFYQMELVSKILGLSDVSFNESNTGIALDSKGELMPFIIDFQLNPNLLEYQEYSMKSFFDDSNISKTNRIKTEWQNICLKQLYPFFRLKDKEDRFFLKNIAVDQLVNSGSLVISMFRAKLDIIEIYGPESREVKNVDKYINLIIENKLSRAFGQEKSLIMEEIKQVSGVNITSQIKNYVLMENEPRKTNQNHVRRLSCYDNKGKPVMREEPKAFYKEVKPNINNFDNSEGYNKRLNLNEFKKIPQNMPKIKISPVRETKTSIIRKKYNLEKIAKASKNKKPKHFVIY